MNWKAPTEPEPLPPVWDSLLELISDLDDRVKALEAERIHQHPRGMADPGERRTYPATVNPETGAVSVDLGPQKVTATMLRAEQETRADA